MEIQKKNPDWKKANQDKEKLWERLGCKSHHQSYNTNEISWKQKIFDEIIKDFCVEKELENVG